LKLSEKQQKLYSLERPSDIFATYLFTATENFDGDPEDTLDEWVYFLKNLRLKGNFKAKNRQKAKEAMRLDDLSS